jgi:metallo-beta-lactamase class B
VKRSRLLLALTLAVAFAASRKRPTRETSPFPAYRIMDNLYYVGTEDIASYLIVTPKGHFLLNSGYEDTPAMIREAWRNLGSRSPT